MPVQLFLVCLLPLISASSHLHLHSRTFTNHSHSTLDGPPLHSIWTEAQTPEAAGRYQRQAILRPTAASDVDTLYIAGLYRRGAKPAIDIALDELRGRNDILGNFRLEFLGNLTTVSAFGIY